MMCCSPVVLAASERLRKLESKGIIKDYVALIDPHVVDRGMLAF